MCGSAQKKFLNSVHFASLLKKTGRTPKWHKNKKCWKQNWEITENIERNLEEQRAEAELKDSQEKGER